MLPISPAIIIVVVRYLIVLGMGMLVHRGMMEMLPGDNVLDAMAQITTGLVIASVAAIWAVLRSTKAAVLKRVAAMHDVSTIHVDPPLAAAMQAQGVVNVIASPPATP